MTEPHQDRELLSIPEAREDTPGGATSEQLSERDNKQAEQAPRGQEDLVHISLIYDAATFKSLLVFTFE